MFLAQNPLPCVVIFSKTDSVFYSYGINGTLLHTLRESTKDLISPVVARDGNFQNCLVYLKDTGNQMVVRRLPSLEMVKIVQLSQPATSLCLSDNQVFALLGHEDGTCTLVGSHGEARSLRKNEEGGSPADSETVISATSEETSGADAASP